MNNLKLTKLEFTLQFTKDTYLSQFIGNTIRGALGQALYKNYPLVYDSILKVESAESIPNPIVISAPYPSKGHYTIGETLSFCITLLGCACDFEQSLVDATQWMCEGKLAYAQLIDCKQIYGIEWSDSGAQHIPACEKLTINFVTPAEIFVRKKLPSLLDFETFTERIFIRMSGIFDNYSEGEFVIPYNLIYKKPNIQTECDLHVVKFQTNGQPITGLLGQVRYYGDVTRYLPYVDLCSQIHIGKKTSRGCGEYSYEI